MITGTMFDAAGGVGYMAFGPKYIESQFRVDTFTANTITGKRNGKVKQRPQIRH